MKIHANIDQSERSRAEIFLDALDEKFQQVSFDWKSLAESGRIIDAVKLTSLDKSLIITLIFVGTYTDADRIANANAIRARWGQNGSLMYVVESRDENRVAEVLGTFAGRE